MAVAVGLRMSTPTPRMKTAIRRRELYADVKITDSDGRELRTTLHRDVQPSDLVITNLKRQFAHLPKVKA
jgi:hypothetical protein